MGRSLIGYGMMKNDSAQNILIARFRKYSTEFSLGLTHDLSR